MKNSQYIISSDPALIVTAGWSDFVLYHKNGNFFQTPEAYYLFEKVPGYSPFVFACIENDTKKVCGILTGVVQQEPAFYGRLTSRSIVWGGPVVNTLEASKLLLEVYCDKISGKAIYSQFRNMFDCTDQKEIFENVGFKYLDHLNFLVKTKVGSIEQLFSGMSKSKSRQIKKGLSTAQIVEATTQEEVSAFYELLRKLYKEKVNKPLPPKIFFDTFFNDVVKKQLGMFLLIKSEGKIIGGIMSPILPGKAIYEWYIAGLDKEFKDQFPSILATWAAIEAGYKKGLDHFDFLGAGKPEADYGVREFKAKFGGELVNFGRFEKIHQPLLMKLGTFGLKMYKFLKR